jgi:CheY-like chemotaxis protein
MGLNTSSLELINKNIVIVEDDIHSIRYYETLLKNTGSTVNILRSGLEFIEYIKQNDTRIYRKSNKITPIIMLTAYASEQTKTDAYVAGCNEYVLKPIYCEKLLFLLDKYLNKEVEVNYKL